MRKLVLIGGGVAGSVASLLVAAPLLVVVALGAKSQASTAVAANNGYGTGLKAGTVPAQYVALVEQAGSLCVSAPPSIIAAQIEQESSWNPNAVSSAGAQGISQFLPSTWPSWAPAGSSPFDPAAAIPAQGKYNCALARQMQSAQKQGRVPANIPLTDLMLAAYNAGPYGVIAAHGIPNNGQTPNYVHRITSRSSYFADVTVDTTVVPAGSFAAKAIATARSQIGQKYSFAGGNYTRPTLGVCTGGGAENDCHIVGWDCSGLMMRAIFVASNGRTKLPHLADLQTRPGYGGVLVNRAAMQPGDLIGFTNPGSSAAHHVGIYIGGNKMIDAPQSGELVSIHNLTSSYYQAQRWRVIRYR